MQRFSRLCFIVLVVAVLFSFGCAAKRICTVTKPCTTKLSNYDCLKIEQFTYSQAFREKKITNADTEMKANILRDGVQKRVQYMIYNLNLFEDVVNTECPDDSENIVALKGEITYLKRVTKAARMFGGAYAGRARVDMDIHLVDFQTDDIIGAASVKGTSTGGPLGGTTEQAFENSAQLIADFIIPTQGTNDISPINSGLTH